MNIFIGIASLIVSTYIGFIFSKKYKDRKSFYCDFFEFNKNLRNEISYSQNTIVSILKKIENKSDFYKFAYSFYINKKNDLCDIKYLNKDEKDLINNYFSSIGIGDKVSQSKYVDGMLEQLKEKKEVAELEEKKYKNTYVKLGFLFGLIILIMLL